MTITDELTEIVKDLNFTITDDDLIDNWTSRESSDFTYYLNTTYEPSSSSLVGNVTIQPDLCDNNKCVYGSCEVVGQAYRCNQCGRRGFCGMDVIQYSKKPEVEIFRCGKCQLAFESKESLIVHAEPPNHI
ncbi:hypothetical protein TNCT_196491 [Trichonephila clavata]|uniref:C2H2-type domain-containing protein n=1 Tax=Trichonephila clavata TaxID=2740835 RepID=A0A8X6HYV3_TRICU|nr:hypothetical protein TNCT_196491 [Trichonephila clavata]